jgi:haloalkane dehalogenase
MTRRDFVAGAVSVIAASTVPGLETSKDSHLLDATTFAQSRRFITVAGNRIAYVQRGKGPAVLFLHGFPLNGFQWRGAIDKLSVHRRCIAPDFIGLGYTEAGEQQDLSPPAQADMLAGLLDALSIHTADLIANDSGGAVAQLFLARHGDRARSLLITNCDVDTNSPPPPFKPFLEAARKGVLADGLARQLADKQLARSPKGLGAFYTDPANLTDEAIDYYFSPLVSSTFRKEQFNRYAASFEQNPLVPIRSELMRSKTPTRIVWATADIMFDVSWAHWLDKTLPQSRGIRLVEGAHLFFPEEMPDLIAEEAMRLWKGLPMKGVS